MLLLLDNCEHLVDTCARLVEALLRGCPELRLLATSREPLGIPGEHVFRTGSLAGPDGRVDACFAFARPRRSTASSSTRTPLLWSSICRRLDGLPLAIELAAARTASLSLDDLASRLDDCFACSPAARERRCRASRRCGLRSTGATTCSARRERVLFDRLSVFAGGWTLDAAEAVCAGGGSRARRRRPRRAGRQVARRARGRRRYRLLETLRQYGSDRLRETGEATGVRDAHLAWASASPRRPGGISRPRAGGWLDRLEPELDNLRAALEWATYRRRRGGPATRVDHVGQPVDVALARPGGPALAAAPARDLGRGAHERARQGPAGRRAGRLPGWELAARG